MGGVWARQVDFISRKNGGCMKRFALPLLVLLSLALVPFRASAAEKPDPRAPGLSGTQRLAALMERVRLQQQELKTVEARFVQKKEARS